MSATRKPRRRKKPDFLIVGAPRCGTTALHHFLRRHPEIFMPEFKEPHFFGSDLRLKRKRLSESEYAGLFADAGNAVCLGEASVDYLYSSKAAAEIKEFNPEMRIIIMLRNPVDALFSMHGYLLYDGNEDIADFDTALLAEEDRKKGLRIPRTNEADFHLFYRDRVMFSEQVERYINLFGHERVFIIMHAEFKKGPQPIFAGLLDFLGVDKSFLPDFETVNPTKKISNMFLLRLVMNPSPLLLKSVRAAVPSPVRYMLRNLILKKAVTDDATRQPMSEATRRSLKAEFAPEVKKLGSIIRRDLSGWMEA